MDEPKIQPCMKVNYWVGRSLTLLSGALLITETRKYIIKNAPMKKNKELFTSSPYVYSGG